MEQYKTDNGVEITPNLRVFTTDWAWGTVLPEQFTRGGMCDPGGQYFSGWFRVRLEDGRENIYNGERMSTRKPMSLRG
jgi:hypothetical protein